MPSDKMSGCTDTRVAPERTAGAAVAAGSAGKPVAECGRPTGTGLR